MVDARPQRRRRRDTRNDAPTLQDVARIAGVSTASASRALTRPELVSEFLCEQVRSAARGLGYVPNAAARALSGRRAQLVGAVVGALDDPALGRVIEGLARRLAADGSALILVPAGDDLQALPQRVRELVARGTDAIAFCGVAAPKDVQQLLAGRRLPIACIGHAGVDGSPPAIGFNRARALALGARYLRELGHRRVGIFALEHAHDIAAVREMLQATDVSLVEDAAGVDPRNGDAVRGALARLLELPQHPSALICGSDTAAAALLRHCALQGIPVPGGLAVVGFGDTELARQTKPTLTTIRVPVREAGTVAAEFLLAAVAGRDPRVVELAAKLIARESTGPGPGPG